MIKIELTKQEIDALLIVLMGTKAIINSGARNPNDRKFWREELAPLYTKLLTSS